MADEGGGGELAGQTVTAGQDVVAAGRDINVITVLPGLPPEAARSAYLEQVGRIVPPSLVGRETELAELARYCLSPDGASYAWWRAGPWAGKSALLSTFVLRPPPEVETHVRFVSFFITARLAAQDTRDAFTHVLAEQLAALLGQSLPAVLPEATREAYLLSLLSQAARRCQDVGGRLVLVVDGLDEDRGVTTGPTAHSIAGLLPADPPAGMRVIVAGRPDPPVPDDVPDWHPLRDPAIIRPLLPSPHARDIQRLARRELQAILHDSPTGRDILALLAAARGGLTARDLATLVRIPRWEVEFILRATAGRMLASRPSLLRPDERLEVYLLGHEELQAAAVDYLGDHLPACQQRLNSWGQDYRARGWPRDTPEYLLGGYFRLLDDLGDLPRMIELASDTARHARMLELTGGDAAALAEARATLDAIAASDDPDLSSALALARHRDHLTDRNALIPPGLPAVWAAIGKLPRAEALAASITDPRSHADALAQVAGVLAQAGQHQYAADIAARAEGIARTITNPRSHADALVQVAGVLAQAGQHQYAADIAARAQDIARTIPHPDVQAGVLVQVAGVLAQAGQHQHAEDIARTITNPRLQADALAQVARALAQAGQHQHAEDIARTITNPRLQADALVQVARVLAQAGQYQHAATVATSAEDIARSITDPDLRADALAQVAEAFARAGEIRSASCVTAAACALGAWTIALKPVLMLAPSASEMLTRALGEQ